MAASNRVGNLIGSRSAIGAKQAAHASALLSVLVGAVVMMIMMATKDVCLMAHVVIIAQYNLLDIRIPIQ